MATSHPSADGLLDDVAAHLPSDADDAGLTVDLVRQYLNDAGRYQLLTREDEADLAKRHQAGLASARLLADASLAWGREDVLRTLVSDGQRAKETMIQANLLLVVSLARRLTGRGLDLLELIQEGNLGLLRAVEKFDHTRGYRFSTYAVWWIRQALQRGVAARAHTIRAPAQVWDQHRRVQRAESQFSQRQGRQPTEQELADEAGLSSVRIRELRQVTLPVASLDRPVGEDGEQSLGDLLADPSAEDLETTVLSRQIAPDIAAALADLDPVQRLILVRRFGLDGQAPQTLSAIGTRLGLSRERVRQLQSRALGRLRDSPYANELAGWLDMPEPAA